MLYFYSNVADPPVFIFLCAVQLAFFGFLVGFWTLAPGNCIEEKFACFEKELEKTLKTEIGNELFNKHLCDCKNEFSIKDKAIKKPFIMTEVIRCTKQDGHSSKSLEKIIEKIYKLKN